MQSTPQRLEPVILLLGLGSVALGSVGCASVADAPSGLPVEEAARARESLARGSMVMSVEGGDEYIGSAILRVTAEPPTRLLFHGDSPSTRHSLGGEVELPDDLALDLAADGWDFTFVPPDPISHPMALVGHDLDAALERMEMRADPNGLFFATLYMREAESGAQRVVTASGRLIGGCSVNTGGAVMMVADPSTVERCARVLGGL